MPLVTFGLPACLATLLLVAHAGHVRGRRFALEFFGLGFAYFAVKENLSTAGYFHVYTYAGEPPLAVGDAPLMVVIGWLFAAYLAFTVAERLLAMRPRVAGLLFPMVAAAMVVTATIAYPVEAVGTSLGWWSWTVDGVPWEEVARRLTTRPFIVIPPVPLVGWPMFVGGFLLLFLGLDRLLGTRWWLKLPLFAAGSALHFEAVHGIGLGKPWILIAEILLFAAGLLAARARVDAPPEHAVHPLARFAPELAFAAMALVVAGFALFAVRDATLLLCLVPLGLFVAGSAPRGPRHAIAIGAGALALAGVLAASPQVMTLSFFPLAFLALVGLRRLAATLRRETGALPEPG